MENAAPQCEKLSYKPPAFWKTSARAWFAVLESGFALEKITSDSSKYHHTVTALGNDVIEQVADVLLKPPAEHKYQVLKNRLLQRFDLTQDQRFQQLFSQASQSPEKQPSVVLQEIKNLAGDTLWDDALRMLWIQRLSPKIQQLLLVSNTKDLQALSNLADNVFDIERNAFGMAIVETSRTSNQTDDEVEIIKARHNQMHKSKIRRNTNGQFCWYHTKFGKNARKCQLPCDWKSTAKNE